MLFEMDRYAGMIIFFTLSVSYSALGFRAVILTSCMMRDVY